MTNRIENEFNLSSAVSQAAQLKLSAAAANGSEAITSTFTQAADRSGLTERGRALRDKDQRRTADFLATMAATQERLAEFHKKLDLLERASYEALTKNEERMRDARSELQRVREQAYEITLPDGRLAKVYRDGDKVRDDDGHDVSDKTVCAEDIPEAAPDWNLRKAAGQRVEDLNAQRREIVKYREKIDEARDRTADGQLSEEALHELESALSEMPASVRREVSAADGENLEPKKGQNVIQPSSISLAPGPT